MIAGSIFNLPVTQLYMTCSGKPERAPKYGLVTRILSICMYVVAIQPFRKHLIILTLSINLVIVIIIITHACIVLTVLQECFVANQLTKLTKIISSFNTQQFYYC